MRSGIKILDDTPGDGALVERHRIYRVRLRMWLNKGEPVRWTAPWGLLDGATLEDDGQTLTTSVRIDRVFLINGLFYGVEGMRIGGTRRLRIAPQFGYAEGGIAGVVPANAVLVAEITFLEERTTNPGVER
jgi:hypothetical protein